METLNASDAKREFGELLLKAQRAPVGINKNGKPIAVVLSCEEYAEMQALKQQALQREIDKGIADLQAGRVIEGSLVMERLRDIIKDD